MTSEISIQSRKELRGRNTGRLVALVYRCFTEELHIRMAEAGLQGMRPAHSVVFEFLGASGSRITDIAERGQVTKQELVRLVNDLEKKGYVERVPDPTDARAKLVKLTDQGWHTMKVAEGIVIDIEKEWEEYLGKELKNQMLDGLKKLVELCSK